MSQDDYQNWSRDGLSYAVLIAMQTKGVKTETVTKLLNALSYQNGVEQVNSLPGEELSHEKEECPQALKGKECTWCNMEES